MGPLFDSGLFAWAFVLAAPGEIVGVDDSGGLGRYLDRLADEFGVFQSVHPGRVFAGRQLLRRTIRFEAGLMAFGWHSYLPLPNDILNRFRHIHDK